MILPSASRVPSISYPPSFPTTANRQVGTADKFMGVLTDDASRNKNLVPFVHIDQGFEHRLSILPRGQQLVQSMLRKQANRAGIDAKGTYDLPLRVIVRIRSSGPLEHRCTGKRGVVDGPVTFPYKSDDFRCGTHQVVLASVFRFYGFDRHQPDARLCACDLRLKLILVAFR